MEQVMKQARKSAENKNQLETPESRLKELLSQATVPFREGLVIAKIRNFLNNGRVPYFVDPVGNIVIGAHSPAAYLKVIRKRSREPLRVFIAHMDHPGFHGLQWESPQILTVQWHGGSPTQHLEGASVWAGHPSGIMTHGKLQKPQLTPSKRSLQKAEVHFSSELRDPFPSTQATEIFGGFRFQAPWWQEGDLIYTQVADDLIGTSAIVELALKMWSDPKRKSEIPMVGLLTRAEEVGFIGAIGHFEQGWLSPQAQRGILCVSLETSRTLPGAEIGKGPIVRLGDRATVFDPGALRILLNLAEATLPGNYQSRIMDGGSCEATAATAYGYPSIGISVPLGNYHNQNFEGTSDGAPHQGPAPEFVHRQDIAGLLKLTEALMQPRLPWRSPWTQKRAEFKREFKKYRPFLRLKS